MLIMRGILITFEGIDGSGKSTALAGVARMASEGELAVERRRFLFTAEPTYGDEGRLLRERLRGPAAGGGGAAAMRAGQMEELFLFMADHARHLAETVIPALEGGMVVVSDRYSDSRAAYQGATLREIFSDPMERVRELHRPWSVVPDRTILFSIDPALAVERCLSRGEADPSAPKGPEKFEREEFLRLVAENFKTLARLEPRRFVVIDASRPIAEVLAETVEALAEVLAEG